MHPRDRQAYIVQRVDTLGACSYQELAGMCGVSEMTIRRDVDTLVERGKLIKTLGGAQTAHAPQHLYESAVEQRLNTRRREKSQIAAVVCEQVRPQQTVFLDGSTTCLVLARQLARQARELTIVTHSALVCLEFGQARGHTIVSLGGQFDAASACFVGPTAEEAARHLFVDVAYFSTKGFVADEGMFESSMATFRIKRIIAEQAGRVVLLLDHSKFGQRALCRVLDTARIHEVITDAGAAAEDIEQLRQLGLIVSVAGDSNPQFVAERSQDS